MSTREIFIYPSTSMMSLLKVVTHLCQCLRSPKRIWNLLFQLFQWSAVMFFSLLKIEICCTERCQAKMGARLLLRFDQEFTNKAISWCNYDGLFPHKLGTFHLIALNRKLQSSTPYWSPDLVARSLAVLSRWNRRTFT